MEIPKVSFKKSGGHLGQKKNRHDYYDHLGGKLDGGGREGNHSEGSEHEQGTLRGL